VGKTAIGQFEFSVRKGTSCDGDELEDSVFRRLQEKLDFK
jgi:hypothetical protein